jgi:hypothetical protein
LATKGAAENKLPRRHRYQNHFTNLSGALKLSVVIHDVTAAVELPE